MSFDKTIGAIGVSLILLAYFCNIFKLIKKDGRLFFLLNILGSALACYASVLINYYPFIILEGIWSIVSLAGFIKNYAK